MVKKTEYKTVQKPLHRQKYPIQSSTKAAIWSRKQNTKQYTVEDATYRQKYPIQNSTKAAIWSRKQNTKPYRSCYVDRNAQYRTVLKNLYRIKTVKSIGLLINFFRGHFFTQTK